MPGNVIWSAGAPISTRSARTAACPACKELEHNVFTQPDVILEAKRIEGLAAFSVDGAKEGGLVKRYGVLAVPRVIFIGANGQVREDLSFVGVVSRDEFVERLRKFGP